MLTPAASQSLSVSSSPSPSPSPRPPLSFLSLPPSSAALLAGQPLMRLGPFSRLASSISFSSLRRLGDLRLSRLPSSATSPASRLPRRSTGASLTPSCKPLYAFWSPTRSFPASSSTSLSASPLRFFSGGSLRARSPSACSPRGLQLASDLPQETQRKKMEAAAFVDIGANLTDEMYRGIYFGKSKHPEDLNRVIQRARAAGCKKLLVTGGSLKDSAAALELCRKFDPEGSFLFATVGVHPTRCSEFDFDAAGLRASPSCTPCCAPAAEAHGEGARACAVRAPVSGDACASATAEARPVLSREDIEAAGLSFTPSERALEHLNKLARLIGTHHDRVAAIGELGLDADRTQFCDLDTQQKYFELQLVLSRHFNLPLFLHMRGAETPFCEILARTRPLWERRGGVVHSFTDSANAAESVLSLSPSLHIGINGCSLKTAENLEVVKTIPVDRLHLETDAPWCDIRPTHAGFAVLKEDFPGIVEEEKQKQKPQNWKPENQIKNRNEPCNITHVARIVRRLVAPDMPFETFAERVCTNSLRMFPLMADGKRD